MQEANNKVNNTHEKEQHPVEGVSFPSHYNTDV